MSGRDISCLWNCNSLFAQREFKEALQEFSENFQRSNESDWSVPGGYNCMFQGFTVVSYISWYVFGSMSLTSLPIYMHTTVHPVGKKTQWYVVKCNLLSETTLLPYFHTCNIVTYKNWVSRGHVSPLLWKWILCFRILECQHWQENAEKCPIWSTQKLQHILKTHPSIFHI